MYDRIVLVTRKTRLQGLIERFNTIQQAKFYIEHSGGEFELYQTEHQTYMRALQNLRVALKQLIKVHEIERDFLPNYIFTERDLVVTIGIDGLVVNTAKYLNCQPIIAVNPDPQNIDGVLLPFTVWKAVSKVAALIANPEPRCDLITMAEVTLNDGQHLLAFNDFFIGMENHTSARYQIQFRNQEETHSSSGIIVSTGAGATGWLSSILNMTNGIVMQLGGDDLISRPALNWESDQLFFVVREPFISKTSEASIVCGYIRPETPLILESQMPSGGVIFSDGVLEDAIDFNAGAIATIGVAQHKTYLVKP